MKFLLKCKLRLYREAWPLRKEVTVWASLGSILLSRALQLIPIKRTQRWDGVKSEQRVNLQAGTDQAAEFSSPQSETRMIDAETICVG